jgi:hypothetical protein
MKKIKINSAKLIIEALDDLTNKQDILWHKIMDLPKKQRKLLPLPKGYVTIKGIYTK